MIREVELLQYLPEFIREYQEIKYLMLAENPDVQQVEDETEKVKNNQFIMTCDIKWISQFERLVGILPEPMSSLDERRRRVLDKWKTSVPYNYIGLIGRLDSLCWNEGYVIRPDFPKYTIELLVSLIEQGQIRDLEWICETYIPANIDVKRVNKVTAYPETDVLSRGTLSVCVYFEAEE
ncbi:MAG: DUF2313 domain-containing protein [Clostridiales bacterium]|nr:DUF2313 domain-containing protein [Clostridiales bacterium]